MHAIRIAAIDLGTNTFHLHVADWWEGKLTDVHRESAVVRLGRADDGQGGISEGRIGAAASQRALDALARFRTALDHYGVSLDNVRTTATSAIRSATNGADLVAAIGAQTGLRVDVITGEQEAEYIYHGVRAALALGAAPSLVVDIGGGSVECLIANDTRIFWKQSFEIGAQRLLDRFATADPLPAAAVAALQAYLSNALAPLTAAAVAHQPRTLVGSSGSFDTLAELHAQRTGGAYEATDLTAYDLPTAAFYELYAQLLALPRADRLALPGMPAMRVDMIVVAACLTDFVLTACHLASQPRIRVSAYALKEGVLRQMVA